MESTDTVRNNKSRHTYSGYERSRAETFKDILEHGYIFENSYITYNKKFIAIKLEKIKVRNTKISKQLDDICKENNYQKVETPKCLTFRLFKI
jgi:hypothetical protein